MGLEQRYREVFSKSLQDSGNSLFSNNSIKYIQGSDASLSAELEENQNLFEVELKVINKELTISCTCSSIPNKPCQHVWAVLLQADSRSLLKNGSKRGVRMKGTAAAKVKLNSPSRSTQKPTSASLQFRPISNSENTAEKEVLFVINGNASKWFKYIYLEFYWRPVNIQGSIKPYKFVGIDSDIAQLEMQTFQFLKSMNLSISEHVKIPFSESVLNFLNSLILEGKLYSRRHNKDFKFAKIKDFETTSINIDISLTEEGYRINPSIEDLSLDDFISVYSNTVIGQRKVYQIQNYKALKLLQYINEKGNLVPPWQAETFIRETLIPSEVDLSILPGRLKCENHTGQPRGHIHIRTATFKFRDKEQLHADLSFHYSGKNIDEADASKEVLDFYNGKILQRNFESEKRLKVKLLELGFRFNEESHKEEYGWKLLPVKLPEVVDALLKEDWLIVADGRSYKSPISFKLKLSTGEDWFDLNASAEFEGETVHFPELIKAGEKKQRYVLLGDGSFGVLPEEWLQNYTVLTQIGEIVDGKIRFKKSQALIIENLLQAMIEDTEPINTFRKELDDSLKAENCITSESFKGTLRPYQIQGLSWMLFLRRIGFGGILADDMGLGKTVQILALLAQINKEKESPNLLVVPRSLVFNWIEEIHKFTPHLKTMDYGGPNRHRTIKEFNKYDIIITTYGTVRQDIERLVKQRFEYCILDEAQVIKNRDSSTHKAIKLIDAKHKISMSGTPVENSLSDLVAQFEFLNPAMTGHGKIQNLIAGDEKLSKENLKKLRDGFKPFILRRTKSQVAKDLPPKTEQVIYCDMSNSQKKLYDKMLKFYQQQMSENGDKNIEYLGALTRLRQMACHPSLVSEDFEEAESAKMEILTARLEELSSEGHKVLVFSQFTSFLGLIKNQLESLGITYSYLDGKTRNRQEVVEEFQNGDIPVFLISLKAGGVGLNLTAADYVFLMDPWWNPAIEAQAIDRAYRIGQNKHVIACKLITRNTVEEKVLKMQRVKKYLANSLVSEDEGMVENLTLADFKQLLY